MRSDTVPYPAIIGGHICLDIIPAMQGSGFQMVPGKLLNVGQAILSTGGAVANTGIALHRLGMPVKLMGKLGEDVFSEAILSIIRAQDEKLGDEMIIAEGESTSYTVVISPPKVDRMFLHHTGANDTFIADDVSAGALKEAGLFHFGYPPLMRRMYEGDGAELAALMRRAKEAGVTTSLDMAKPDPASPAGAADWRRILSQSLPYVDICLPSVEEILFMLRRELYEEMREQYDSEELLAYLDEKLLESLASELLAMGAAIVVLKLGEQGLFMRCTTDRARLEALGRYRPQFLDAWTNRALYAPCFEVEAAGTTGAGDCTIAGFLSGFMQGLSPEEALIRAIGTGACNVERPDATSGIPAWQVLDARIAAGWKQHEPKLALRGYHAKRAGGAVLWSRE